MVKKITKTKIIWVFTNDYGKTYYLRELANLISKPHQTIKPYVEELVKEKILFKNIRKNITEYGLNFNNKQVYDYLVIAEKEKLNERIEKDLLLRVLFEKVASFFSKATFVIFGSSAEKTQKESDVDLLVLGDLRVKEMINEFEETYNKKIHLIQVKDLSELNKTLIKEIYKKHLIFNNTEKLVRFFGGLHEKNKLV